MPKFKCDILSNFQTMCALGWPGCQQPTCSIGFGHPTEFISATALQSFLWQIEWKQSKVFFSGSFSHRSDNLASKHWKPILSVSKMKLESPKEKESNGCEPLFFPSLLHLLYAKHDLQLVLLEEEKEKKKIPRKRCIFSCFFSCFCKIEELNGYVATR